MAGLFGNTFGNLFGNLFGDVDVDDENGRVWRRERRPIRRYTDWTRWSDVATEQARVRNELNLLARIATDVDGAEAAALVQLQNHTTWIDMEFSRTSDMLDKAQAQVQHVQDVMARFESAVTPEPPPPPPVEVSDVMARFRGV